MKRASDEAPSPAAKKPKLTLEQIKARVAANKLTLEKVQQAKLQAKAEGGAGAGTAAPTSSLPSEPQPPRPALVQPAARLPAPLSAPPPATAVPVAANKDHPASDYAYFDPRMGRARGVKSNRGRRKGALNFVDRDKALQLTEAEKLKGSKFGSQIARGLRDKDRQFQAVKAQEAAAGGLDPNLVPLGERTFAPASNCSEVPDIEWWDATLLTNPTYEPDETGNVPFKESKVTNLVEHPVPLEPPAQAPMPAPQPLKLTKKEQKKMRKQRREAREKEKQHLIQEGLLEPAKPKVKISNMHRVFGADGVLDATAIEVEVRKAAAERSAAHEDRNLAKKLTKAERKEKKVKKLFDDDTLGAIVQVFRVNSLSDGRHLFKVDINAKENRLTGACITTEAGINVVVVEGCAKSIRRFNHLMLNRIDWNPAQGVDEDDEDMFGEVNKCHLVWEGTVNQAAFTSFTREKCVTEHSARQFLAAAGVVQYWDVAKSFQIRSEV